jgi:hypothetical protein
MSDHRRSSGIARGLAAGVVTIAVLVAGFYLLARNVGQGTTSLAVGIAWWLGAGTLAILLARRSPGLLAPVAVALGLATLAGGAYIYPSGASEVDEEIAVAEPTAEPSSGPEAAGRESGGERAEAGGGERGQDSGPAQNVEVASGSFEGVSGHSGTGEAAVIELAEGGRVISFGDFEVDPGAGGQDLRIWLSAGDPDSDSAATEDYVEVAPLRGEAGDQQYELPEDVNLDRYSSVVIWCVPFTTRIAQADLG